MSDDFMSAAQHFEALLCDLSEADFNDYKSMKTLRTETAFIKRNFVIYEMQGRDPVELDRIVVNDFVCNETVGASTELYSQRQGKILEVSYTPVRLFDHPIFVFLPLHGKIKWDARPGDTGRGSLAFPIVIRTQSRLHLRERGVVFMETGPDFGKEFDTDLATA